MPRFQLPIAVTLAASALASFALILLHRPREGKIQLPLTTNGEEETHRDPFDVTTPEDLVDGEPIDNSGFWARTRLRKIFLALLLVIILALQTICLGWSISLQVRQDIIVYTLHVVFAAYLVILSVFAINQNTPKPHTESIYHLSSLILPAVALLGTTALLPTTQIIATSQEPAIRALWYTVLALYIASFSLVITTPTGPPLHFPNERIYSEKTVAAITNRAEDNVSGVTGASVWGTLLFSYTTKVVMLGNTAESLDIGDLPIVPGNMRATHIFAAMRATIRTVQLRVRNWRPKPGSGWELSYRLLHVNALEFATQIALASSSAMLYYAPPFFLQKLVYYLELDPMRENRGWGWFYAFCLFSSTAVVHILTGQLWSISTTTIQVRIRVQLNSILFAKTLVRKDVASSAASSENATKSNDGGPGSDAVSDKKADEDTFSSKAQIMTLMTTDVDRVSEFSWHLFTLVDSPIEIIIGAIFLYKLLGVSCFFGLGVSCLFLPINHLAGKVVVGAQENLMKARDERVALMNEVQKAILGAIRMLKFMAWERNFEDRVLKIREKELKYQKLNYTIETLWNAIWNVSPIMVTLVSFFHFTVIRHQVLTPSIAFTSIAVFSELKFALNALPETLINMLQSFVSLRRIEKYLRGTEVAPVPPLGGEVVPVAFRGATVTWPQDRTRGSSAAPSAVSTPHHKFVLTDLNLTFPRNKLSLICGKLGSGKTLLLLALLGEADVLTGQVICPRTPPDTIASFGSESPSETEWIVEGVCAYVPQAAWLRNASIKDNILFNLPYNERRYQETLEVCALVNDLKILEDGDESEIGERGVNLSGGQKARVSLARAVYSRASILLLDDVLSAVDAHTAHHIYHECLKGDLMLGRTLILVSHHVQLCCAGADYIVTLSNGRVLFQGDNDAFQASDVLSGLVQSGATDPTDKKAVEATLTVEEELPIIEKEEHPSSSSEPASETSSTAVTSVATETKADKKAPRKLIEEEKRAVGRIGKDVWNLYIKACGGSWYWAIFIIALVLGALSPVAENGWLTLWSGEAESQQAPRTPMFWIGMYATITAIGLVVTTIRWFILYTGSIHASTVLYKKLLDSILFANIRFHDTTSRGRLLNRFGKDFEGIDSSLSDNFGRSIINGLSALTTLLAISAVGGLPFFFAALVLGLLYYNAAKVYGQTSRDMRRLDSVTRSPLYSIYGETIAGVTILRAFGASSKFLRDMLRCVDTNTNPYYWMWGVNRWLSIRFNLLSSIIVGVTGVITVVTPRIDAALAGFALAFATTITNDILFLVRRFVSLEQSMVALERVKEFSEIQREAPEFIEPRPPASWPSKGEIRCEDLVIRYAPDLPDVLHNLNFSINPGEKVGILGRTGSGKSTLALSFFRFVEATEGCIRVDGLDISKMGLTDLRSRLTIIPQDPTILSGTLRSTLDVFDEYEDAEIYEALRRVHLIPSEDDPGETEGNINANVFRNLDFSVSEGGENFSTGEKQLLCMARAILKRSKVLVMDEATASVDYATDELISKTIRHEFAESTILTIAHRLRTVIDYNRVMLLEEGRIVEFDSPGNLLSDSSSKFYALCKATGKNEFAVLKKMAEGSSCVLLASANEMKGFICSPSSSKPGQSENWLGLRYSADGSVSVMAAADRGDDEKGLWVLRQRSISATTVGTRFRLTRRILTSVMTRILTPYWSNGVQKLRLEPQAPPPPPRGSLPAAHNDAVHAIRCLAQLRSKDKDIEKFIFLSQLKHADENMFYRLCLANMAEFTPIIYTPTVGDACIQHSHIFRRPEGIYISIKDKGKIGQVLRNWPRIDDARISVVTDGSRILGLGDLGVNGMPISIGKLSLYIAGAGIRPTSTIPICLDLGTNNQQFLDDPLYLGLRHKRVSDELMTEFMEEFMQEMSSIFPKLLIQFEDFSTDHAFQYLDAFRHRYPVFNDDIQGTGAVVLSGFTNAAKLSSAASGEPLSAHRILFLGAGSAGVDFSRADYNGPPMTDLVDIIEYVRPTALLGLSTIKGAFNQEVIETMATLNERPIVFPLSNPVRLSECEFQEAVEWSRGSVLFASGSPFPDIELQGHMLYPGQGNNMYIFPGLGLGAILCQASSITDSMVEASSLGLADSLTSEEIELELIYPRLERIRDISAFIAVRVIRKAQQEGVDRQADLRKLSDEELLQFVNKKMWNP
ncbi:hypothetical protein EW146_g360 [Bondarzewia mesenterica]|uniref:Uncharacterized protein n=1 Tax=Bondarzewia mesenterica TaxID=1095465 RepID=A0A4S4M8U7_9AGAM|nr:hypothetical protein EW146_g360 [Bondarzewia mesenterica]